MDAGGQLEGVCRVTWKVIQVLEDVENDAETLGAAAMSRRVRHAIDALNVAYSEGVAAARQLTGRCMDEQSEDSDIEETVDKE